MYNNGMSKVKFESNETTFSLVLLHFNAKKWANGEKTLKDNFGSHPNTVFHAVFSLFASK